MDIPGTHNFVFDQRGTKVMPVYVAAGRTYKTYDAKGIVTKSEYDDAGRVTRATEDDGGIGRVTEFIYNADGQIALACVRFRG